MEAALKVSRWGNSLAVRLPSAYVEALHLEDGDEVSIPVEAICKVASAAERRRAEAIKALSELAWDGPPGFTFRRDDIYEDHRNGFRPDPDVTDER
jgi:antitoxin MazE